MSEILHRYINYAYSLVFKFLVSLMNVLDIYDISRDTWFMYGILFYHWSVYHT